MLEKRLLSAANILPTWLAKLWKPKIRPPDLSEPGDIRRINDLYDAGVGAAVLGLIGFRARQYLYEQPDLVALGMDEEGASSHYLAHGLREHRFAPFTATLQEAHAIVTESGLPGQVKGALSFNLAESRMRERTPANAYPESVSELLTPGLNHRPILVFGDSHIVFYTSVSFREVGPWLPIPFVCMGASARGLVKAESRLKYGATIIETIEANLHLVRAQRTPILFHFGQNDVEFVYHFKRAASGDDSFSLADFEAFIVESVERYLTFLKRVRTCVGKDVPILVGGILPPTLSDANLFQNEMTTGDVAWATDVEDFETLRKSLSRLEMPNWIDRTRLHRTFNEILTEACRAADFPVLDILSMLLDQRGLVGRPFIRAHQGKDHHLDNESFETQLVSRYASLMLRHAVGGLDMAGIGRSL